MSSSSASASPLTLALLLLAWGVSSSWCDTLIKAVLVEFPFPVTITFVIFIVSSLCGGLMFHVLGVRVYQDAHKSIGFWSFKVVMMCQMTGFLLTYGSYGRTDVSFSQTIKASAPLFSLAISVLAFGERFTTAVYLSLVPIIVGVIVTSATEMTFDVVGMMMALGSNVCFTSRSIFGKPFFAKLDSANLYHYMCVTAFLGILPIWLLVDAPQLYTRPAVLASLFTHAPTMIWGAVLHWVYNMISVWVLSLVAPLTHAVCNVLRRVLVICVTIVYFGRSPSWQNIAGILTVFSGVAWYSQARAASAAAGGGGGGGLKEQ